jgi:two-component system LytT family sensor kinase
MDASVPNLMLQPVAVNAIRHGVASRADQSRLEILAHMEDGHLRLSVQDNAPGIHRQLSDVLDEGVGLRNTRARLEQLYGDMYRLDIRNRPEGGLAVDISIPFESGAEK